MVKTLKKSTGLMLVALVLMLAMSASAFANPYNSYNYYFNYEGAYDAHSSIYIVADAIESGGYVTITLAGNYFPEVNVDGVNYTGVYNSAANTTSLTFPGSSSIGDIDLYLHVIVTPWVNKWYPLTLVWD